MLARASLAIPGVEGVAAIHSAERAVPPVSKNGRPQAPPDYIDCARELVTSPALGHCPAGADVVAIEVNFGGRDRRQVCADVRRHVACCGQCPPKISRTCRSTLFVVSTNGTSRPSKQTRTTLERLFPRSTGYAPETISEHKSRSSREINRYRQLANVVLLTSLPIAGCSLAVSIAGGLAERRRPFSLLRLTGTSLGMLRRVVSLEAAVPLLISVVLVRGCRPARRSACSSTLSSTRPCKRPVVSYYALIVGGVLISFAIISSTMPLLARITGPEAARND